MASGIDTVYAVAWPASNIVKVGYSHNQRWRTFTSRGGEVITLEQYPTSTAAFAREALLHSRLARIAPRAFQTRAESRAYLGAAGSGWVECYQISAEIFKKVAEIGR